MHSLSLAMIVKNEAAWIEAALASVAGLATQCVVVDTGSTDDTRERAAAAGAEVFQQPWTEDFAAARNAALERCSGDWILILDADEQLEVRDHAAVRQALSDPEAGAFRLVIRNYVPDATTTVLDQRPVRVAEVPEAAADHPFAVDFAALRLFRRDARLRFTGRIHETVEPALQALSWPTRDLSAHIHHFGKLLTERETHKRTAYLTLARADAQARPEDIQAWFNLHQQAILAESFEEAIAAAEQFLARSTTAPMPLLYSTGAALMALGRAPEALAWLVPLVEAAPDHEPGVRALAQALIQVGRNAQAHALLASFLEDHPQEQGAWTDLIHLELQQNQRLQVGLHALQALQACPEGGDGLWQRVAALALREQGLEAQAARLAPIPGPDAAST